MVFYQHFVAFSNGLYASMILDFTLKNYFGLVLTIQYCQKIMTYLILKILGLEIQI